MKHRALPTALAAAVALAGCTVGCTVGQEQTPRAGGAAAKKEITFLVFETPNLTPQVWDAAIKRVTDKYPDISVKKLVAPSEDRVSYAKQLLASGQFPDVMIAVSPAGFAESGAMAAFTPDELKDFQFPGNGAVHGKVYQLPTNTQTIPVVYYNRDLFAKAGIGAPPRTYAELLDACAKLKAENITPFVIGGGKDPFASTLAWTATIATDVYAKTPDWMARRRAGSVKFTDPDFVKATTKFADLAAKGYIDKKDVSRDYAATEQAFLDGKGAMYPMGNWFAAAGDDPKRKPSWEIGAFTWPSDDASVVVPAFTGGGLSVSASAKHLAEAKKFALAYTLDTANLDNSVHNDGLYPAIKGYTPPADTGAVFKLGYDLYRQGVQADRVTQAFGWEAGDDGMPPGVVDKWRAAAQDLVTGSRTVDQVLASLDDDWAKAS
ncbi:extracellular solute-binding protein [Sphaerisporangium album]|uniref:Extracellular solute-binding protein n=1 Tax=Sphaerisporangium album TaxID=509200 RepID=A0A367FHQ7_9ACTN|nr:extracellular solute-binding protein [Sphaerisporangium album]RCG29896.1 extracellular solute-binding protein [Sphaerisporangium album]